MSVPDLERPIIGYRSWWLAYDQTEVALCSRVVWPKREKLVAGCWARYLIAPCDQEVDHHCGIYAYNDRVKVFDQSPASFRVYEEVALWGKVVVHQYGYRAQYAYPSRLYCQKDEKVAMAANVYGIPVSPIGVVGDIRLSWQEAKYCASLFSKGIMCSAAETALMLMKRHVKECGLCTLPEEDR